MLKAVIENEADVPEPLREHYQQKDGKFFLAVDGIKTQADVDKVLAAKKKEVDEHNAAKEKIKLLEERVAILEPLEKASGAAADVKVLGETLAQAMTAKATQELAANVATVTAERDTALGEVAALKSKLTAQAVGHALQDAARESHVLPSALPILTRLAATEFKLSADGVPQTEDGRDAAAWLEDLKQTSPFFWPTAVGARASGAPSGDGFVTLPADNPWTKGAFNLTKQSAIARTNPTRAAQLKAEAARHDAA